MRILVAGIGNIFLGDDAFGVEVVNELVRRKLPDGVLVRDFGIRSYDLAYAMMDGYDVTILVDATPHGQAPGTLYLIEPDLSDLDKLEQEAVNAHSMNPVRVLQMLRAFGSRPGRLYLAGCEPGVLETEEIGLSEPVRAAVPQAIGMIESLIDELLRADGLEQCLRPDLKGGEACGTVEQNRNGGWFAAGCRCGHDCDEPAGVAALHPDSQHVKIGKSRAEDGTTFSPEGALEPSPGLTLGTARPSIHPLADQP
jgi:hydrogenase maturation protease